MATRRVLIYDSALTGHHPDYLWALYEFVATRSDLSCTFMVPAAIRDFEQGFQTLPHINFRYLSDSESAQIKSFGQRASGWQRKNSHAKATFELKLIQTELQQAAQTENAYSECILMYLDYFQEALSRPAARDFPAPITGVLFQPYTRTLQVATSHGIRFSLLFRAWRKRYRLWRMLKNKAVVRICIPGDEYAVSKLQARHHQRVEFATLPEPYFAEADQFPVEPEQAGDQVNIKRRYEIDGDRLIMLVFGRIIARKNVPRLIQAIRQLPSSSRQRISLLVLGSAEPKYQSKIQQQIQDAMNTDSALQLIYDPSYIDQNIVDSAFVQCDFVAIPYLKAYQSSGILFLAAKQGKPVLASNLGLIADWVEHYALGQSVDVTDVDDMSRGIESLLKNGLTHANEQHDGDPGVPPVSQTVKRFLLENTPTRHASVLLNTAAE